jgi:O-methyltransferase involved in polyketide biosynthesis
MSAAPLPLDLLNDGKATILIIEGVLMYLSPEAIDRLFLNLRQLSAERVRIIFSFMSKWPDGSSGFRPRSWLIERWLAWRDEPFVWAVAPEAMPGFLSSRGFKLVEMALTRELSEGTSTSGMLEGENLVLCEPEGGSQ